MQFDLAELLDGALKEFWLPFHTEASAQVQGYLAHTKLPPPRDHLMALGMGLLKGSSGLHFLMSEVPL